MRYETQLKDEIYEFIKALKPKIKPAQAGFALRARSPPFTGAGGRKRLCRRGFNRPVKLIRLTRHYNVAEKDPEVMEKYQGFNTHAQFHESYLKALFAAKNISYSKRNPGDVLDFFYLEQLLKIIADEPHLMTFRNFINFCDIIKKELPTSPPIM